MARHFTGKCRNNRNPFDFLSVKVTEEALSDFKNFDDIIWHRMFMISPFLYHKNNMCRNLAKRRHDNFIYLIFNFQNKSSIVKT